MYSKSSEKGNIQAKYNLGNFTIMDMELLKMKKKHLNYIEETEGIVVSYSLIC